MLYRCVSYSPGLIVRPPTSTVVYPDTQAVFTCEPSSGYVIAAWYVNGTDSRLLPEEVRDDTSNRADGFTEILIITARTQYNNTVVQCLAIEIGGSGIKRSDNVTLTIQGTSKQYTVQCIYIYIIVFYMYMYNTL